MESDDSEEHDYWTVEWKGPDGSEVVVDLWSGAVGVVHRDRGTEDCTTSGQQQIMYLPELKTKTERRFAWVYINYDRERERATKAGFGAFNF